MILIADYNTDWPLVFAALAEPVREALGSLALRIEHVGSTSVVGLAAKPVIDIDVVIPTRGELPEVVRLLAPLGYRHVGDKGIPSREAFSRPENLPKHHLYVCAADSRELRRHLVFRDHLRAHPEDALAYAALKRALARHFGDDVGAYSVAKTDFVSAILRDAGWRESDAIAG